ncbi:YndJ family protein [Bacillus dakarensis]|uniref:YndJ family protein n=1 Tax=Robertmurraya dakarensis TaxID=1926278 RepID=UPI000982622B|nr:YndJ family protein [Bacillus dakarensis]
MRVNKLMLFSIILFLLAAVYGQEPAYLLLLTVAQVVYIPIVLYSIIKEEKRWAAVFPLFSLIASVSVIVLHFTPETGWDYLWGTFYLLYTFMVALYGVSRFFRRGFVHLEEFAIDVALIYLSIGGMWFFAHITEIDTGFSPIITWLTAIHFHYSAFLLPVFVGFLGRLYKPRGYSMAAWMILLLPLILAVGITYSVWIELFSVLLYIAAIYMLIIFSSRAHLPSTLQKWLIVISFSSLGVTILFSLVYAYGNFINSMLVSIDTMLRFHGVLNSLIFALLGVAGWMISVPPYRIIKRTFPVSNIRGKRIIGEKLLSEITEDGLQKGLVDNMSIFTPDINVNSIAQSILDFYENTLNYRLFAEIKWRPWFKPFAAVYRIFSRRFQQINLPLSEKQIEMTGDIVTVKAEMDGRKSPRAWVRKANGEVIFAAIYSWHENNQQTYMNIALPLPWSSMIGVLELTQVEKGLQLTSKKRSAASDSGIYLAVGEFLLALPIEETFHIREEDDGSLIARHRMWFFSVPFLNIHYRILRKEQ